MQEEVKGRDNGSFMRSSLSSNRPNNTRRKESLNKDVYIPSNPNK